MADIGATIAAVRGRLRMSQTELAKRVGVRAATVSEWESGKSQPTRSNVGAVAHALGMTVDAIIDGSAALPYVGAPQGSEAGSARTAEAELPRALRIMALDFEKEALEAGADENFIRFARQALRNPELVAMFEGGYEAKPMSAEEQRIEMQAHIDGLRGILKTRMERLKAASRR
jgi:transcriptional regulator with XRE-family HTH domain